MPPERDGDGKAHMMPAEDVETTIDSFELDPVPKLEERIQENPEQKDKNPPEREDVFIPPGPGDLEVEKIERIHQGQ